MEWKNKVRLMEIAMYRNTKFADNEGHREYFLDAIQTTDTFHPFDTDYALESMDEGDLYNMFCDIGGIIEEHFRDVWNHAPGYVPPAGIEYNAEAALATFLQLVEKHTETAL
jgi:hypothetical protein